MNGELKKDSNQILSEEEILEQGNSQEEIVEKTSKRKKRKEIVSKEEYEKLEELYKKALNTAAHHENLTKYYRSEYEKLLKYRSQSMLEAILPSLDGFQLAFKYEAPTKEAENYKVGFEFVYKLLLGALVQEGMSEITPKIGDEYNPAYCQVVDSVETNEEEKNGEIIEVLLSGYKFKDRVIRPANVKVYALKKVDKMNDEEKELEINEKELQN